MTDENATTATMGRQTKRGEQRCQQLKLAAGELFLAHGYDGVSLDDIIAQAGGSKTNIYSRFGGKDGLFIAAVEELCDSFLVPLVSLELHGLSLEDGLRVFGRTLLTILLQDRHIALQRLVIAETQRLPELGAAWSYHGPDTACRLLSDFIERRAESGRPRALAPNDAAQLFHDMVVGHALFQALYEPGPIDDASITRTVDNAVAIFLHGYER